MIQRMNMKVITLVAIMHENKEISILYTQSVLTDCLILPDIVYKFGLCYIRYISLTRTKVFNSKGIFCLFSFYSILYSLQLVVCI